VGAHCKRIIRMRDGRIEGDGHEAGLPASVPQTQVQTAPTKEELLRILAAHEHQAHKVLGGLSAEDQTELSRLLSSWARHLPAVSNQDRSSPPAS
jgi:hypothetical protein